MTVTELIDQLKTFPPDANVYIYGRAQDFPEELQLDASRESSDCGVFWKPTVNITEKLEDLHP